MIPPVENFPTYGQIAAQAGIFIGCAKMNRAAGLHCSPASLLAGRLNLLLHREKRFGFMGIQDKVDVALLRHAYVRTKQRKKGIGTLLLQELIKDSKKPILIGTWKAADWAIHFYEKHGFRLVEEEEKNRLLKKYWAIPDRQVETSVILVDGKYKGSNYPDKLRGES